MNLLHLFGIDRRLRRIRIAAGEGAMAVEDRAQLLNFAWEEERARVRAIAFLLVLVLGLTMVAVAVVSLAVVVHFWDTPHRVTAAWTVSLLWVVLWVVAVLALLAQMRATSDALTAMRREMALDWDWVRAQIGAQKPLKGGVPPRRPATREELLQRIVRQRERIAELQTPPPKEMAQPTQETLSQTATRVATEHPVATAVVAASVVAVVGPRRLLRTAAWLAPIIWRMRQ